MPDQLEAIGRRTKNLSHFTSYSQRGSFARMGAVDFILNLTGLLLWLNWRSVRLDPLHKAGPLSLAGTLHPATPRRSNGWGFLLSLALLLGLRAWLYRQVGAAADWVPKLDVGLIVLPFRSDRFWTMALFSLLSVLRAWVLFYFWLGALAACRSGVREADPILKLVRLHLGRAGRWHWSFQLVGLLLLVALGWAALYVPLLRMGIVGPVRSLAALAGQSGLVALALVFSLKTLVPILLLLYFVASYVYLGSNPWWDFVSACARTFLAPLRPLPLRVGKLDLAPLAGVVLVLLVLQVVPELVLRRLSQARLTVWPQ